MIRAIGGQRCYVAVISAGRPENVKPMSERIGGATWYVPPSQHVAYHNAGVASLSTGSDTAVVPVRNAALRHAWQTGAICIQLDDDLQWAAFVHEGRSQRTEPMRAIEALIKRFAVTDFRLAGASPTNNAYFTRKPSSTNLFIRSGVIAVKPCRLLMDEALKVKFDYDYTIQHFLEYGGALRCDDLIFEFQQRASRGGHAQDRAEERDAEAVRYLRRKWGDLVKIHPRRRHEVLLNLKRHKREVLT